MLPAQSPWEIQWILDRHVLSAGWDSPEPPQSPRVGPIPREE